jgi:hypothetical protein
MNRLLQRSFNALRSILLPTYERRAVNCIIAFMTLLLLSAEAQEKQKPLIAKSSNLSSALSAGGLDQGGIVDRSGTRMASGAAVGRRPFSQ